MSLSRIRLRNAINNARAQLFKAGVPVTMDRLRAKLRNLPAANVPILKPYNFPRKSVFNVEEYNRMLKEISEDYESLFESALEDTSVALSLVSKGVSYYDHLLYAAKVANDEIHYNLLRANDPTRYFIGVFDTFTDTYKIDLPNTTADVELGTESVRLPIPNPLLYAS